MAQKRSDKSTFKSPSTGDFVTCGQYIAEILCTRQAEKENKGTPAYKFWSTPKWEKIYRRQVTDAYKFIKEFGEEAVITYIKSDDGKRVYSFGFPGIKDKIRALKLALDEKAKREAQNSPPLAPPFSSASNIQEKPRPVFGKKSMISKLNRTESHGEKDSGSDRGEVSGN